MAQGILLTGATGLLGRYLLRVLLGNGSKKAYEKSNFAAEQLPRDFPGIRATIYRPSIIVGDSRTGYTSPYHHFYRFLELAVRLAGNDKNPSRRRMDIRLPLAAPLAGRLQIGLC